MKTRAEIYGQEAAGLLRTVSMYPGVLRSQLCRFYPGREEKTGTLLSYLERQGRIIQAEAGGYFLYGRESASPDHGLIRAVWVLLDFIGRVEFHSPGDFPVKLLFFADGELYEVIYAAAGRETLITQVMVKHGDSGGRRIVLVEEPEQITAIDFPGISGFCTVGGSGKVSYYKKQTEGGT